MSPASRAATPATPATLTLTRVGIDYSTHPYDHDPRSESFGEEAARQLDLDPRQVLKTLLAQVDELTVVAMTPVSGSLDLKRLASAAGGRKAQMCDAATAERLTGYVVGGISPIGQKRRMPTFLDASVVDFDRVYVSGGRRGLDIGLSPWDLVTVTNATVSAIGRA